MDPDWIRIGIQPKMLDPDPYQMKTDPKPCSLAVMDQISLLNTSKDDI
jgi:hypothetical protein